MVVVTFILTCVLVLAIALGICFEKLKINDSNVIIGFIGVLATFVVVGNYAQTADMRDRTENKITELEGKLKEAKSQLEDAKKLNNDLSVTIENFKNKYDIVIKKDLLRIINKKGVQTGQSGLITETIYFNKLKEVRSEDGKKYTVECLDSHFLVDIIEETATKID